jgi:flavin reductase (DIM6/NTAB) family NADH-FMN oxidoreductase RutF
MFRDMTHPADALRAVHELVAGIDYPMYIVTAAAGAELAGCLVGFATQCSIRPPRFLVCVSERNRTHRVVAAGDVVVVHLVPSEAEALARLFGGETGDEVDKFARCDWRPGPGGAPVLAECGNWYAAHVLARLPAGDHTALLLEPFDAASDAGERPFTFHRARRIAPGHEA